MKRFISIFIGIIGIGGIILGIGGIILGLGKLISFGFSLGALIDYGSEVLLGILTLLFARFLYKKAQKIKRELEEKKFPGIPRHIIYETDKPLAKFPERAMLLGVCAGLSRKFKVKPVYFRTLFILFSILIFFNFDYGIYIGPIVYLILAIFLPTRHYGE